MLSIQLSGLTLNWSWITDECLCHAIKENIVYNFGRDNLGNANRANRSGTSPVQIGEALPQVFRRTYPIIEPTTQMLLALSLLRFHEIDALPIGIKASQKKRLAVFGYSCLSLLLETPPKNYGKFLELPPRRPHSNLLLSVSTKTSNHWLKIFKRTSSVSRGWNRRNWQDSQVSGIYSRLYESGY